MQKFAVFDIDGTLFRFALFHSIVERMIAHKLFSRPTIEKIEEGRKKWKARSHSEAFWDYVKPSVEAYESSLRRLNTERYQQIVDEVFETEKDHVYTYTRDLINRLRSDGYMVIAISGSQSEIVEKFARYYKFNKWVGTEYEQQNGKFTGNIRGAHSNKHIIIADLMKKHNLAKQGSVIVGDTNNDISMLMMADTPIAFNPNSQLLKYAQDNNWKIVVERKNVIYELEPQNGTYRLAQANKS